MGSYLGFTNYIINDRQFAIYVTSIHLKWETIIDLNSIFLNQKKSTLVQAHQFPIFVCTEGPQKVQICN